MLLTLMRACLILLLTPLACAPPPHVKPPHPPTPPHHTHPTPPQTPPPPLNLDINAFTASAQAASLGWRPRSPRSLLTLVRTGDRRRARIGLTHLLAQDLDSEPLRHALTLLAGRLAVEDRDPSALTLLDALPIPTPHLNDRRLIWLARAEALAGEHERALRTLHVLETSEAAIPERLALTLLKAELLHATGEDAQALTTLTLLSDGERPWRARALTARALWTRDPDKRLLLHKQLLALYPEYLDGVPLEALPSDLSPANQLHHARRLMRGFRYEEARRAFEPLLQDNLDARYHHALIDTRWLADHLERGRLQLEALLELNHRPRDVLHQLIETTLALQDFDAALQFTTRFLERFPDGEHHPRVAFLNAAIPFYARDCPAAIPALQTYLESHTDTIATGLIAWCHIRSQSWQDAIDAYAALLRLDNPLVRGKALYWQAYAHLQRNEPELAKQALETLAEDYPLTYYDALGRQLLAQLDGQPTSLANIPDFQGLSPLASVPDDLWSLPNVDGATRRKLERVQHLIDAGEVSSARRVYSGIRADVEQDLSPSDLIRFHLFITHQLDTWTRAWKRYGTSTRAHSDTLPEHNNPVWQLIYPRAYAPLILSLAQRHEVPWPLLTSIMLQKTRFSPHQRANTDALGAFLLRAPIARRMAKELGRSFDPERFDDPLHTFELSALYLHHLTQRFEGSLLLAVAAEQSSPERVEAWTHNAPNLAFAIEELADSTTYNYTRKVAEHTLRYIYLYENDAERRATLLDALFPPP